MELTTLFSALSEVIIYSIFYGFFVYAIVKFILKVFPELPASERYKILYLAMIWIFISFIISFSDAYLTGLEKLGSNVQTQAFENRTSLAGTLQAENLLPGYFSWIAVFYFVGLFTQFAILVTGLMRVNNVRNRSLKNVDLSWNPQLKILARKLDLEKKVKLAICYDTLVPCTIGFFKPIILLPVAMINRLSPGEVEAVLLHELAHISRNDYLFNIIQRVMEMVLFFNPVIWFIGKEIRREREFCCDDLVLQNATDPLIYAQSLLQIAENKTNMLSLSLSALGENKFTLLTRIKRLTTMKPNNSNPKQHLFTTLTVIAVCFSLAWIIPAEKIIKKQKKSSTTVNKLNADTVHLKLPNPAEVPPAPPIPSIHLVTDLAIAPTAPNIPEMPSISAPPVPAPPSIPFPPDTNELKKKFSSQEWKKHMEEMKSHAEEMKKHFDSPEWKKQIADMKSHALAMEKQFNSPEWKKKIEDMKQHSLEMKKQFYSPEWKKKFEDMRVHAEEMRKQFDSPEWKKKIEEMRINSEEIRKQFDSPEWKNEIDEIKKKSMELKQEADKVEKSKAVSKN